MDNWRAKDPLPLLLVLLTMTTGLVDAVSYLGLGRVFTANMTGNIVVLGFALAGAKGFSISSCLLALGAFLIGAALGGRIGRQMATGPRRDWLLTVSLIEMVFLLAAAFAAQGVHVVATDAARAPIIGLTAIAMGLRNATVRRLAVPDLTATVLTLTITGLAADSWFGGGDNPRPARRIGAVASMLAGAFFGALLVLHSGLVWALVVAAGITVVITVLYSLHPLVRRPPPRREPS